MPRKSPKPLATFRLRPGSVGGLYALCNIWPSRKAMREHCHWVKLCRRTMGAASSMHVLRGNRMLPLFAEINLTKEATIQTVTHEISHVALRWAERKRLRLPIAALNFGLMALDCDEEKFCHAISNMCIDAAYHLQRLGIWGK